MTNLEKAVQRNETFKKLDKDADKKEVQKVLDEIAGSVLAELKPNDIIEHAVAVYNETAEEYRKNSHTQNIIPELLDFMAVLPNGARVLDIGCGPGRDAFFMTVRDQNFRKMFMENIESGMSVLQELYLSLSEKILQVDGIDRSTKMLDLARERGEELKKSGLLTSATCPSFGFEEMHSLYEDYSCPTFNGIWSCTALFTHTPKPLIGPALATVSSVLKTSGIFFTSYTNGAAEGRYEKLLLSSTGKIKYFSHPDPNDIARMAKNHSLGLIRESYSDYKINGKVIKENLFVSQFYRKV